MASAAAPGCCCCCSARAFRHAHSWRRRAHTSLTVPNTISIDSLQSALLAALLALEDDQPRRDAALEYVQRTWPDQQYRLTEDAAAREGGLWLLSPADIALRRRAGRSDSCEWRPYASSQYASLYEVSPYGDTVDIPGMCTSFANNGCSSHTESHLERATSWRRAGKCGAIPGVLKHVPWPAHASDILPSEARRLLSSQMCFVIEGSALWPSALENFGDASYLATNLATVNCHVLAAPADNKEFAYFLSGRKFANLAQANAAGSDRIIADYQFEKPNVTQLNLPIHAFLESGPHAQGRCLYLQHPLLRPGHAGAPPAVASAPATQHHGFGLPGLAPTAGMGARMVAAISDIRIHRLRQMEAAVGVGPWTVCQLFVGNSATAGARTRMHFDQYDNFYLQISGTKTFRLFDPTQTGNLAPYPVHHRMDRSAQALPPRADAARGTQVTLRPGDLLFLPAYWWHEVTTGPLQPGELAVSINFWYSAIDSILRPSFPLRPPLRMELSRQLEYLVSDSFGDAGRTVPAFFTGLRAQVRESLSRRSLPKPGEFWWPEFERHRPIGIRTTDWVGLMEYVLWRLLLLLEPGHVYHFLEDLCDVGRFEQLVLSH
eukprot:scaffold130278_cov35-Tisochrysis_lutea.AAC.1